MRVEPYRTAALARDFAAHHLPGNAPFALAGYYDVLARNAFGNFRALMEEVTLHPAMGVYLSMLGNQKPDLPVITPPPKKAKGQPMAPAASSQPTAKR